MKKFIIAALFTLLLAPRGEAQVIKFGIRGGVNTGVYTFDDFILNGNVFTPINDGDVGYQLGVVMRFQIPGILYIQPELNYVNRVYSLGVTPAYVNQPMTKWKMQNERVEFPVALGLRIAALRLFGGPIFSLESRQTLLGESPTDVSLDFNDNDIAAFAGIGLDMKHLFFEARCVKYLKKTQSEVTMKNITRTVDIRNDEYWQFSVGFFF